MNVADAGRTVLVADDDRAIRTVLSQALARIGCRVRATGSTSALWRMVEEGEGNIVVTDVHMPDGDALDLLPAIRRRRPDLPVIVMSAQNTVLTAIRAAEVGAYEYLPKPFDLKELLAVVEGEGNIVVTDVHMPDGDALDLLPAIRRRRPDLPVIVMSAQNTVLTAIRAAEVGAYEYLPKPFDLKELLAVVEKGLGDRTSRAVPAEEAQAPEQNLPLIGRSPAMQEVYRVLARLMNTDLSVMVTGESGTGKELVARALHNFGRRSRGPFVAINMAAIPRELIESELFGHEKGAFTGATERATGRFEQAQG
ncbi:MAG: response regulator, partial [Pseudomonadota bacterium]